MNIEGIRMRTFDRLLASEFRSRSSAVGEQLRAFTAGESVLGWEVEGERDREM